MVQQKSSTTNKNNNVFVEIISGSLSGALTRFLIAPLDVVKIRFQLQHSPKVNSNTTTTLNQPIKLKYSGIVQSIRDIVKEEGLRSLWKGNLSAEFLWISYGCVQFTSYHYLVKLLDPHSLETNTKPSSYISLVSGACAGVMSTVVSYPFDIIRTNIVSTHTHTTITKTYQDIKLKSNNGYRSMFKGLNSSLLQIVPQMALQFMFYESSKHFLSHGQKRFDKEHPTLQFVCGALSGSLSKFFVLPFDVVKKRLQVSHQPITIFQQFSNLYHIEGFKSFFKGATPSLLKAGLSSALSFMFYEQVKLYITHSIFK
ncbi:mitochondrial substrate carrier family protein [Tieghemostelium lacteum]|uniref:Mitochondrial substrate carrier family protein n=1 Tax=Tieghemostelium lacteum TaxID=361077 RepID=A0A151Z471_TIELA|nr:mitochondrial substrate carrier family protein [Tieghemostelium lacteum]|eukprot:KYQ88762.1 mitochondrial substrate carrier family protein [Tieghemostelium lacteum]